VREGGEGSHASICTPLGVSRLIPSSRILHKGSVSLACVLDFSWNITCIKLTSQDKEKIVQSSLIVSQTWHTTFVWGECMQCRLQRQDVGREHCSSIQWYRSEQEQTDARISGYWKWLFQNTINVTVSKAIKNAKSQSKNYTQIH
jgi:hypothetical protein